MRRVAERPKVLALGSGITLLGVMRALSEIGVDVMALPDADPAARRSRWYRPAPRSFIGVNADTIAERLENLPSPTVLVPCSDFWARTVAALPVEVRARYPSSSAPLSALDLLVDKGRFGAALDRLRLPHPTTRKLKSIHDLELVSDAVLETSFLKPVQSQQFFARFGVKAFMISDRSDAQARLQQCAAAGLEMVLQEYIPGPPTNHYFIDGFVDRAGIVKALFARQRLRMSPPDFGNSTMMVSVSLGDAAGAIATLKSLLADIEYRGIFSAEFKRDERDGTFNLIEVNARPWWYVEFAARCGVNVCDLAVRDALGENVPMISTYAIGRRCVFPYYDLQAVRAEMSAGRLGIFGWARSWLGPYQPVFRWSDPLPAMGEVAKLIGARVRKGSTRPR
jgi:D-aspartate ligase